MLRTVFVFVCLTCITANCVIVSINRHLNSYWHQTNVYEEFDFVSAPKEISYVTLHFKHIGYFGIGTIKNFPNLEEIYLDECENKQLPALSNLPKLKILSAMNNGLTSLSKTLFSSEPIQKLILSSNNISTIEDGTFGRNLEQLHMVCNKLKTISPKWFKNPSKLKYLSLTANHIQSIPAKMFKDFNNLETINLRNNEIKAIGNEAFVGLNNVVSLSLSYNQLLEIKPTVFDRNQKTRIKHLDIQFNKLTFLHPDFLNRLDLDEIEFWGNPWQCPCREDIYTWHRRNVQPKAYNAEGLSREGDPGCVLAHSFSNVCVHHVDEELVEKYYEDFEIHPVDICSLFQKIE